MASVGSKKYKPQEQETELGNADRKRGVFKALAYLVVEVNLHAVLGEEIQREDDVQKVYRTSSSILLSGNNTTKMCKLQVGKSNWREAAPNEQRQLGIIVVIFGLEGSKVIRNIFDKEEIKGVKMAAMETKGRENMVHEATAFVVADQGGVVGNEERVVAVGFIGVEFFHFAEDKRKAALCLLIIGIFTLQLRPEPKPPWAQPIFQLKYKIQLNKPNSNSPATSHLQTEAHSRGYFVKIHLQNFEASP